MSASDPLRKSATGSGSGSGRLVVEIVGGVTEVSLHVRYGGSADLGRPPIKQMFEPIEAVKIPLSGSVAGFAGDIGAVAKLAGTYTGDTLSGGREPVMLPPVDFPEPIYRIAVRPATKADEDKLGMAIGRLIEEDPTFRHARDSATHQEILEGMGDIHLDAVIEKLKSIEDAVKQFGRL